MRDIVITLPQHLWEKICTGEKKIELRKYMPKFVQHFESKCWVINKGSSMVLGYFTISGYQPYAKWQLHRYELANLAAVDVEFIDRYLRDTKIAVAWFIDSVYECRKEYQRNSLLGIGANPQSYVYIDPISFTVDVKKRRKRCFRP